MSTTTSKNASIVQTLFDLFWDTAKFLFVYDFTNPASITTGWRSLAAMVSLVMIEVEIVVVVMIVVVEWAARVFRSWFIVATKKICLAQHSRNICPIESRASFGRLNVVWKRCYWSWRQQQRQQKQCQQHWQRQWQQQQHWKTTSTTTKTTTTTTTTRIGDLFRLASSGMTGKSGGCGSAMDHIRS